MKRGSKSISGKVSKKQCVGDQSSTEFEKAAIEMRKAFYEALDSNEKDFPTPKFGTKEWSDSTYNLRLKRARCPNGCLYCYVNVMDYRFTDIEEIPSNLKIDPKKVKKNWQAGAKAKKIMFPSTHDIFPDMVQDYIGQTKKMIDAGHKVLCVSKPRLSCIKDICSALQGPFYKKNFMFRFTIGTDDDSILRVWEPFAPTFQERVDSLKHAFQCGFRTSVSMEPLLDNPLSAVDCFSPFVTDSIWIGLMNYMNYSQVVQPPNEAEEERITALSSFEEIEEMVNKLRHNPLVFWKKSVTDLFH